MVTCSEGKSTSEAVDKGLLFTWLLYAHFKNVLLTVSLVTFISVIATTLRHQLPKYVVVFFNPPFASLMLTGKCLNLVVLIGCKTL